MAFVTCLALVASLAALAPASGAAPVPADVFKGNVPANLTVLHALIARCVDSGQWPIAEDEKLMRNTLMTLLDRVTKVGELEDRKLPVDFAAIKKSEVTREFKQGSVQNAFVLAGDVQGTVADHSVILASGDVSFTVIKSCVVVGKNVRFNGAYESCIVVSQYHTRGTTAEPRNTEPGCVLVAGRWLTLTRGGKAVCHVIRPGTDAPPDENRGGQQPAIRMTTADGVVFLNSPDDIRLNGNRNNIMLAPKMLIAK
jgi:hypothetical protein